MRIRCVQCTKSKPALVSDKPQAALPRPLAKGEFLHSPLCKGDVGFRGPALLGGGLHQTEACPHRVLPRRDLPGNWTPRGMLSSK